MTPKRGDDVAPPAVGEERRLCFATNEAAKGWVGGRVRYLVDEPRRTVHLVYAAPRDPKDTD